MAVLANLLVRVGVDTTSIAPGMDKAHRSIQTAANRLTSVGTQLAAAFTVPIAGIAVGAARAASSVEQATVAFTTLSGSVEVANRHIAALRQFSLQTPFQFEDLIKASRLMQAYGFSIDDVLPKLRVFGDAVSALGGGSELLERVVRSMGEIGTRGRITGEQLRELSRAGIPALRAIAEAMGVSMADAQDKITKGAVDAKTASEALLSYMERRFGGGMAAQAKTVGGMWSNLKDQMFNTFAEIGKSMQPLVGGALKGLTAQIAAIGKSIADMNPDVRAWGIAIGAVTAALPILILGVGKLTTAMLALKAAFGGPVTWGFLAVSLIAGAVAAQRLKEALRDLEEQQKATQDTARGVATVHNTHWVPAVQRAGEWTEATRKGLVSFAASLKGSQDAAGGTADSLDELGGSASKLKDLFSDVGIKDLTAEAQSAQSAFTQLRSAGVLTGGLLQSAAAAVAEAWKKAKEQAEGFVGIAKKHAAENMGPMPIVPSVSEPGVFTGTARSLASPALNGIADASGRASVVIAALSEDIVTGMREAAISAYHAGESLKALGPIGQQVRAQLTAESIPEMFREMNTVSSGQLSELASAAKFRFEEINAAAGVSFTDRLRAQTAWVEAELALLRDLAENQKGIDRDATLDKIRNLEKLERKNREVLNRATGDTERRTRDIAGFWRKMGQQVSTIVTDLSRRLLDILWPRSTGAGTNAEAITALGLAAGVTGDQLKALAAAVENLALATGQSFSSISGDVGDVFGAFKVSVEDQIPLMAALYNVCLQTGVGIEDLLAGLKDGAPAFKALGWSASQAAAFLGNVRRQGGDTKAVVGALNTALQNLKDQGFVDPQAALRDLIDKIKNAATESDATAIAIRYFGNAGQDMARIIRSGGFEVANFSRQIDTSSEAMDEAAENTRKLKNEQSKLKDILDEVGRAILRAFAEAGMTALVDWIKQTGILKTAWEGIVSVFKAVADWIGIINTTGKTAAEVVSAVSTAGEVATGAGGAASTAGGVAQTAGGAAGQAGSAAAGGALGIVSAVAGVGTMISSIIGNFQMHGINDKLWKIEDHTLYARAYLSVIVDRLEAWVPKMHTISAGIETICLDLGRIMEQFDTALGYMGNWQPAYAAAPAVAAQMFAPSEGSRSIRGGDTYITIGDVTVLADSDIGQSARQLASYLRARGVRHSPGLR